jgi:hypothetical protein
VAFFAIRMSLRRRRLVDPGEGCGPIFLRHRLVLQSVEVEDFNPRTLSFLSIMLGVVFIFVV